MTVRGPVTWLFAAWLVVASAAAAAAAPASTPAPAPTREYVVQTGDTCIGIVNRELGDPKLIDALHKLNPGLGRAPHVLKQGQILRLPVVKQNPDAALALRRGQVEVLQPGSSEWAASSEGQDLFRSWRVGTRSRSSAKIRFLDDSTITMREETVAVILGSTPAARRVARTSLERGILRAQLSKLDGKPRVTVETPAGAAQLTYGASVIDVVPGGETRLSNHTGAVARLSGKTGRPVAVKFGFGSRVVPGKAPEAPTPLPPPPTWVEPEGLMLGWNDQPIAISGEWSAVPGASKYRLEIVHVKSPEVIEAQLEVPATIQRLDASNLPAGEYEIRVSTVDAKGLEGLSSEPRRVRVVELPRPPLAIVGTKIAVPPDVRCAAGRRAPEKPGPLALARDTDGRARVTCAWRATTATLEIQLQTVAVKSASKVPRVRAGQKFELELVVDGVAPGALRATGRGGIQVVSIEPTARGVRLALRAVSMAPGPGVSVEVAAGGRLVPIGTVGVPVDDGPAWLGSRGTLILATGWFGVSGGRDGGDDLLYGAEMSVDVKRWLAPHLAIWQVRGNGFRPGTLLGATFKVGRSMRPLLRLGGTFEDGQFGGHAGLGFEVQVTSWLALRATLDGLIDAEDTRMHAGLGVVLQP